MRTSLNHQPEAQHPKSPAIRWVADYPIFGPNSGRIDPARRTVETGHERPPDDLTQAKLSTPEYVVLDMRLNDGLGLDGIG
jgi:hypothetical protein